MADKPNPNFDEQLIRRLAAILKDTELSEIEYAKGDLKVRVAQGRLVTKDLNSGSSTSSSAVSEFSVGKKELASSLPEETNVSLDPGTITAPMVGLIYNSPDPQSPPFVKVGDNVKENQILFLIEAMKVFNQIKTPKAGKVIKILVEDGSPVEFGEPLIVIR